MIRPLGVIATRKIIDLSVSLVFPPIPTRNFDYSAIDANTYDADCDQDGYFSNSPRGDGATEIEAINDLLDQLEDDEDLGNEGVPFSTEDTEERYQ